MRITVIHRYFWPDTPPYASFLRSIAGRWRAKGHDLRVLTAQPSYTSSGDVAARPRTERVDGVSVERLPVLDEAGRGPRQLLNLFLFPVVVAVRLLLGRRPDVVMCSTAPQVTLGAAVSLVTRMRRARFIYHCMDLHPEIGRLSGEFANPVVYRVLATLDRSTMRRADRVVVLSEDMRSSVVTRDPALADKVVVLNNFALPDEGGGVDPLPAPEPGVLRVVFTGNLGRFQGLEDLVRACGRIPDGVRLQLVFMGEGKARPAIEATVDELSPSDAVEVVMLGHRPAAQAKSLMRSAHVGVVSLVPEVVRYAYPSKTATYAVEGLPVLVICEPDSDLSRAARSSGLGWSVASGDVEGVVRALTDAAAEMADGRLEQRRDVVRSYAAEHFDEGQVLDRWDALLEDLLRDGTMRA